MSVRRRGYFVIDIAGYSISGEIGRGGMAVVYRARQVLLDREVALKVLNPSLAQDPVYAQRFLQEARMLASLGHPHIVPVYDVGVTPDGLHYFSMQMVRRGDFAKRLREGIDEVELVRVLIAVAQALGFAHARGYVHRDVTPANILFDDQNKPVLTDFGIARALAATSRMTASGLSIGTSHYMSPEQARGGEVDRRSDIYSLGVLCFEALSGHPPYDGEDGFAVAYAHVHEPIPRLPEDLAKWQPLIDRCMAKAPDERYPDCAAFIEGLRTIAAAEFEALMKQHGPAALGLLQTAPPADSNPKNKRKAKPAPVPAAKPAAAVPAAAKPTPSRALHSGAPSRMPLYIIGGVVVLGLVIAGIGVFRGGGAAAPAHTTAVTAGAATTPPARSTPARSTPVATPVSAATTAGDIDATSATPIDDAAPAEFALVPDLDPSLLATVIDPVEELLARGRTNLAAQRYSSPPGNNALDRFSLALTIEPGNADALAGITSVAQVYIDQARAANADIDATLWDEHLAQAERIAREHNIATALAQVQTLRDAQASILLERGKVALASWDTDAATVAFERAAVLVPGSKEAAQGLHEAAQVGKPGYVFSDAMGEGSGPELVVVGKIALGRREVSVGEFRRYWNAAGKARFGANPPACRDRESVFRSSRKRLWNDPGFKQGDNHPVVCVSHAMAEGYVAWLGERSGKRYRLPKASELTQAGAGLAKGCAGNVLDADFRKEFGGRGGLECSDGYAWTAPVGGFAAEKAGLYDTGGNVREWTSDCDAGNCRDRQAIGASWFSGTDDKPVRAFAADAAFNTIGLRVAREID